MVRVKNVGTADYFGSRAEIRAGAEAEVADDVAAYLLSPACPGNFEKMQEPEPREPWPSGKPTGRRGKASE